jgi:hypothetical protein
LGGGEERQRERWRVRDIGGETKGKIPRGRNRGKENEGERHKRQRGNI